MATLSLNSPPTLTNLKIFTAFNVDDVINGDAWSLNKHFHKKIENSVVAILFVKIWSYLDYLNLKNDALNINVAR